MDGKRFDTWTRNRARRLSRRDALRVMGASGAAAIPSLATTALAQTNCSLTIHAETAGGPSAPAAHDGTLQFTVGSDGTFTQATFASASGGSQTATGHATGRAIDFEVILAGNQTLAFSGTGDGPISTCQGAAAGILTGPSPGDIGGWQATADGGGTTSAPASSGQSTGGSGSTTGSGSNGGGSSSTACPSGTEQCGANCVPSCTDGQSLDLDTCTCPPPEAACIQNQQTCQNHGQCCSGYCGGGTCFDCSGKVCGGFGCVDPNKDSQNCGNCGNVCFAPNGVCLGGVCSCIPDGSPCSFDSDCCSQGCNPSHGTCGCVAIGGSCSFTEDCCQLGGDLFVSCFFQTNTCTSIPKPCESNTDCLSGNCVDGSCQ